MAPALLNRLINQDKTRYLMELICTAQVWCRSPTSLHNNTLWAVNPLKQVSQWTGWTTHQNHLYHNCEQQTIRAAFSQRGWKGKNSRAIICCSLFASRAFVAGAQMENIRRRYCSSIATAAAPAMNKDLIWAAVFVRHWFCPSGRMQAAPFPAACSELAEPRAAFVRKS